MRKEKENRKSSAYNIDELLNELSNNLGTQVEERKRFAEKARLTGDNADHRFNQLLRDYLDGLQSDGERLEACHNIIKICKSYVREYQKKSVV
ncbi:MAG: hypothetical protein K9K78_07490 [Spirochaetales bacterium]|nr:hypothetical protein [Spirochaetales bacterium]